MCSKRKYDVNVIRMLWIDSKNKCPICKKTLTYFDDEDIKFNFKGHETLNGTKQYGEIAHIISFDKNNIYPKEFIIEELRKKQIRPKTEKTNFFPNEFVGKEYKINFINSYNNLIILCIKCHRKIDGKLFKSLDEIDIFLDGLHKMTMNEQIKKLCNLKSQNPKIITGFDKIIPIEVEIKEEVEIALNSLWLLTGKDEANIYFDSNIFTSHIDDSIYNFFNLIKKSNWMIAFKNRNIVKALKKILKFNKKDNNDFPKYKIIFNFELIKDDEYLNIKIINKKSGDNIDRISFTKLREKTNKIKSEGTKWIWNDTPPKINYFESKEEFKVLKDLFIESIKSYSEDKLNEYKSFRTFSIAYMARWGTGKTTIIRSLAEELKDSFNFVEINLWHIANTNNSIKDDKEDNTFVRTIVKEAITQLSNSQDLTNKYLNSTKKTIEFSRDNDLKEHLLNSIMQIPKNSTPETIIMERAKFLDQFISSISSVTEIIFNNSKKPTVFVFDDLDRIEDEKTIVQILDALIAFLNIKNSIYIIPIDEAKIIKAISHEKPGKDPYSFMNKYFNYSIRAPFMPRINSYEILEQIIKESDLNDELFDEELKDLMSIIVPMTYRGIKDYLNSYNINWKILKSNTFINNLKEQAKLKGKKFDKLKKVFLFATAIQIKAPLLADFLANDLNSKDVIFKLFYNENNIIDKIIKILKEEKTKSTKEAKDISEKLLDIQLWTAIINLSLKNVKYENMEKFVENISNSISTSYSNENINKHKNLIIEKLEYLNRIFKEFDFNGANNNLKMIIWTSITLATIEDKDAQKYAKTISYSGLLKSDDENTIVDEMQEKFTNNKEITDNEIRIEEFKKDFLSNLKKFSKKGFYEKVEYNKIILNIIKLFNKINIENVIIDDSNLLEDFYNIFIEMDEITNEFLCKFFNKQTKKDFMNLFIKDDYNEKYIFEENEQPEKISKIKDKIKQFLDAFKEDLINEKIQTKSNFLKENLNIRFNFAFLKTNNWLKVENFYPLDIEKIIDDENMQKNIIDEILKTHNNFEFDSTSNQILRYFNNKNIQESKEYKNNDKLNIKNLLYIIENNNDFTNFKTFKIKHIVGLLDYMLNNVKEIIKNNSKIELLKLEIDGCELLIFKNIIWLNEAAKNNNERSLDYLFKNIEYFIEYIKEEKAFEYLFKSINEITEKDKWKLEKLVNEINLNSARKIFQDKFGWSEKSSFEGEEFNNSTPLIEIINLKINKNSNIKISKKDLLKKLNSDKKIAIQLLNAEKDEIIYDVFEKILKTIKLEEIKNDEINLLTRNDEIIIINGNKMSFDEYLQFINMKNLKIEDIFNETRKEEFLIKKESYDSLVKELTSIKKDKSNSETIDEISKEINETQNQIKLNNEFSQNWIENYEQKITFEESIEQKERAKEIELKENKNYDTYNNQYKAMIKKLNEILEVIGDDLLLKTELEKPTAYNSNIKNQEKIESLKKEVEEARKKLKNLKKEILQIQKNISIKISKFNFQNNKDILIEFSLIKKISKNLKDKKNKLINFMNGLDNYQSIEKKDKK